MGSVRAFEADRVDLTRVGRYGIDANGTKVFVSAYVFVAWNRTSFTTYSSDNRCLNSVRVAAYADNKRMAAFKHQSILGRVIITVTCFADVQFSRIHFRTS
jgi:hypothetical protein